MQEQGDDHSGYSSDGIWLYLGLWYDYDGEISNCECDRDDW